MIVVRDMFLVSSRARSTTLPPQQSEMDIDNCFRLVLEFRQRRCFQSRGRYCGACSERVRWGRKVRGDLWFSMAKGGDKTLDHTRKGSENKHMTVNLGHVLKFVKWDVFHNTEFVFGSVFLAQGDKGVPIGGSCLHNCVFCGWCSVSYSS